MVSIEEDESQNSTTSWVSRPNIKRRHERKFECSWKNLSIRTSLVIKLVT